VALGEGLDCWGGGKVLAIIGGVRRMSGRASSGIGGLKGEFSQQQEGGKGLIGSARGIGVACPMALFLTKGGGKKGMGKEKSVETLSKEEGIKDRRPPTKKGSSPRVKKHLSCH